MSDQSPRIVLREDRKWEQVVFSEVLVPGVPNSFGDIYTLEAVREFAYEFARVGYGIDVNHDNSDQTGKVYVVESFIARDGDPDFLPGSWVVGMKIADDELWARVLSGNLNGYSYEAVVNMIPLEFYGMRGRQLSGTTSADPSDGHTHTYLVIVDELNKPISGSTSFDNGHAHTISSHTVTDVSSGHNHRIQVVGSSDDVGGDSVSSGLASADSVVAGS